ncbi:MAG: Acetyltransferase domain [Patescibacteria group bacterium]|nr:Acetyltransferase domain [Patescibacteria group bacterium]
MHSLETQLPKEMYFDPEGHITPEEVYSLQNPIVTDWVAKLWGAQRIEDYRAKAAREGVAIHSTVVRDEDAEVIAAGDVLINSSNTEGHLANLVVRAEHRGRGIGQAILFDRVNFADTKNLALTTVLSPQNNLRTLYHKLGFSPRMPSARLLYRPNHSSDK